MRQSTGILLTKAIASLTRPACTHKVVMQINILHCHLKELETVRRPRVRGRHW
jgi:hypothetical protein